MEDRMQELEGRMAEIDDLRSAASMLGWDQMTYMPPGGAPARGRQLATLERLAHERLIDPALGKLLDDLQPYAERLAYDSDEASLVRISRRLFERAIKLPSSFVAELNNHQSASYQAWSEARPTDDFCAVQPYLEKTVELSRRYADYFPGYAHVADPLIDRLDYGLRAAEIGSLFAELRRQLVPLVEAITDQAPADDACIRQHFPEQKQWDFGLEVIKQYGYDLHRGRQDKAPHPFTTRFSIGDVRITVRIKENFLGEGLFSALHEAGHAMYEQGIDPGLENTPLARGTSAGVHESQSRLWENTVGRSRSMWRYFYPKLQEVFPEQLRSVPLEAFYRAINKVERSPIRTDADEVTYNLHVMLRFDLELALLEGKLAVKDLPEAWRTRTQDDLGIHMEGDRDGVLQDIHWYYSFVGGLFQGYTLGNILSAQFYEAALQAHPEIPAEIEQGEFGTLHSWLKGNIYRHGSKFTTAELVERVTGGPMQIEPYMRYLRSKYGELYELP